MLTIYDYENASKFLLDAWGEKKKRNPSFSMRSWAKKLGFQNNTPLSLMLNGKRPISRKYIPSFIEDLNLSSREGIYLESLIEYNCAKDDKKKIFYYKRLKDLNPSNKVHFKEVDIHDFFKDPIHFYLLEIINQQGFKFEINWIKEHLAVDYSIQEIKSAFEKLIRYGYIQKIESILIREDSHFMNKVDIPSQTVRSFHISCSQKAIEILKRKDASEKTYEREMNSFIFNFNKENLPQAKEELRDFYKQFIKKFEITDLSAKSTYQLNLHFFKIFEQDGPIR